MALLLEQLPHALTEALGICQGGSNAASALILPVQQQGDGFSVYHKAFDLLVFKQCHQLGIGHIRSTLTKQIHDEAEGHHQHRNIEDRGK